MVYIFCKTIENIMLNFDILTFAWRFLDRMASLVALPHYLFQNIYQFSHSSASQRSLTEKVHYYLQFDSIPKIWSILATFYRDCQIIVFSQQGQALISIFHSIIL